MVMFSLLAGHRGRGMEKGVSEPAVDDLGPDLLAETAAMAISPLVLGELDELRRGGQCVDQGLAAAAGEVVLGLDDQGGPLRKP